MIRPKNGHETWIAPQSHKFHASMKFMTSCRMSHFISTYLISISYLLSVDIWFFCSFTPAVAVQPAELLYKGVPWGQQAADHHLSSERWRFREDAENSFIKILIPRTVSFVFLYTKYWSRLLAASIAAPGILHFTLTTLYCNFLRISRISVPAPEIHFRESEQLALHFQ